MHEREDENPTRNGKWIHIHPGHASSAPTIPIRETFIYLLKTGKKKRERER
jgi:hypothetical protein